jgi:ubiquinone/menaquinone biosynthesis C-methylase UbiE
LLNTLRTAMMKARGPNSFRQLFSLGQIMNYSAMLLAVVGCFSMLSGCDLSESDAEANPAPISAVTPDRSADAAASADDAPAPSTVSPSPAPIEESESTNDVGTELSTQGVEAVEPAPEESADEAPNEGSPQVEEAAADAQETEPVAESRYTYSEDHDPNGIGKFYMGREIAQVMGHQGIAWLERPEREEEERLSLLIECLEIEEGSTVADIGAGSGVITTRLCDAVGDEGTVVAVDIQQEMLDALQLKCHELGYRNVELVLGTVESPQLAEGTLDLVIMVDVYHEFDHPYEMLLEISRSLKPGGRVAFVEYRKEDPTVPIKEVHKMTEAQVRLEAEQPEFQLEFVETIDELPRQHVIVFQRIEPTEEP